jgi:photosystem II stability/assembly factor-like uncharacterized protein
MKNFTNPTGALSLIFLLIIHLIFLPLRSMAQQCDVENWVNPVPQGNNLTYVDFITSTIAYATGIHGTIIKTTNGGSTWSILNTGTNIDLYHIQFINQNVAIAAGAKGSILKTTDGGTTWIIINTGIISDLTSVHFPTFNIGYATASDGSIIKSADNGNSWTALNSGTTENLKSIFFTSPTTGVAVGGSTISGPRNTYHSFMTRTTDGGITWIPYVLPRSIPLTHITFFTDQIGIVSGGHPDGSHASPEGTIIKTTDGGQTWQEVFYGSQAINSFDFAADQTTGIAIGYYGTIKTTDGGNTWNIINYDHNNSSSLSMDNLNTGIDVGDFGRISKTTDGGITWTDLSHSLTNSYLASLQFPDPNTGYAVVSSEPGSIIKTTDGGINWKKLTSGMNGNFLSLYFTNSMTGYVTSYNYPNYEILKTSDGGNSWNIINSTPSSYLLRDIKFVSANTGFAVGDNGLILRTTNGGTTWNAISGNTNITLTSIDFFSSARGVIVGDGGTILKTSDGGTTWSLSDNGISEGLNSVSSVNKTIGFAVGDSGNILRTNNAGKTWSKIPVSYSGSLMDVYFIDEQVGYIASNQNGDILKTIDGGSTWTTLSSITSSAFYSLFFPAPGVGFVSGTGGSLIKISTCDAITGPVQVIAGSSNHYNVSMYPGVGYQWSISGGGKLSFSGSNANVIWSTPGTYTLTCKPSSGQTMILAVIISNNQPLAIRSGHTENSIISGSLLKNVNVFPNPSNGNFVISFSQPANYSLRILNALGNEVYKADLSDIENTIKLEGQLKGMFYIQINSEEGTSAQKIVIE